jgi:hypothetical protein
MRSIKSILLLAVGVFLPAGVRAQRASASPEAYVSAAIDALGNLMVVTENGRRITVSKQQAQQPDESQTSFEKPTISDDHRAVGAVADFPTGFNVDDLPLQLVVYSNGKIHRFKGIGLPIFDWHFVDGGKRVAFEQEPLHFSCAEHWELWDIDPEKQRDDASIPQPCGEEPNPTPVTPPKWVSGKTSGMP